MSNFLKKGGTSMEDFFKKTGLVSIVTSIVFAVLGLILMYNPSQVLTIVCYILGTVFIIIGGLKVIAYFMAKGKYDLYNYDLAFGIIAIVAGIVVIFASETIMKILAIIIGIWIIYSGLVRLGLALKLRKAKSDFWIAVAVIAAIMIICGLYMVIDSSVIVSTIGLVMLIYAILDIIEGVIYMKTVKQLF